MEIRQSIHSAHFKTLDTGALRHEFLIERLFAADHIALTYSHVDRIIVGGAMPVSQPLAFDEALAKQIGAEFFWRGASWG